MQPMYYIGLDVHKRKISYCVKDPSGAVHSEGLIPATRFDLDRWMKTLPQPWSAALEATMFSGWIYDHLKPHAAALKRRRYISFPESGKKKQIPHRRSLQILSPLTAGRRATGFGMTAFLEEDGCGDEGKGRR